MCAIYGKLYMKNYIKILNCSVKFLKAFEKTAKKNTRSISD